jgi:hypothetical protein
LKTTNTQVTREVADLIPYARNARTHSEAQVAQIAASIREFGFTNPVLIDEQQTILAGYGRVLAAKLLKMDTVPCVVLTGLSDAQKAAYVLADNKLALNAGWNDEILEEELGRLAELEYDLALTAFSEVEIATLLEDIPTDETDPDGETDPADHWKDMPDFRQPDRGPFRTILVHFKDQAAVDAFAQLIAQSLTDKTKYVWYPQAVKAVADVVYAP